MAIMTAEAFLAVLEKSELLTTEQFAEAQDATLLTGDAAELAEMLIRQDLITAWQSTQLLAGRSALFLGNYALMDLLGRGGMGSVFLARHRTMDRRVALKVVSKQVGKEPASLERFLAEARLIASLDHPNIVQAYDVDKESDRFYIVMEYIKGQDLDVIVQEHGLFGFEEVADCIRQAADGLDHAHGRNMIHCDIKPSNLLLSDQGTIKILDMGMARLAGSGEDSSEQVDHKVLGTIDYMSPEQAMDGPNFDHRADIYSLGCTLYFLLTGHPPFDEGTLTQRIVKHQTQPPPDIFETQPDAPQELVDICMKMMAKDPDDRYQSAAEVSSLLTGWQEPVRSDHADHDRQPESENQPRDADSKTAQGTSKLAMEELQAPDIVPAGPALQNKMNKRTWSEEQHTVILVAALVCFAIIALSVALIVMAFNRPQTTVSDKSSPNALQGTNSPDATSTPAPKQPSAKTPDPKANEAKTPGSESLKPKPKVERKPKPKPKVKRKPKPKVKRKPKPKPVGPFHELPNAVDLKLLTATVRNQRSEPQPAFKLAMLHPGVDSTLKIELVGGGSALPRAGRFILLPVENGKSEPTWLVRLEHSRADKDDYGGGPSSAAAQAPTDVARIWFGQGVLMFEWLADVVAETANHLKNCELDITIDGKTRTLALSRTRVVEPLTADLVAGTTSRTLIEKYLPNVSHLRLAVTALECPAHGGRIKKNIIIKAKGQAEIEVGSNKFNPVMVRVSYDIKGGRTLVVLECFYQPIGKNRFVPLREIAWKRLEKLRDDPKLKNKKKELAAFIAKQKGKPPSTLLARKEQQLEAINRRLAEAAAVLSFKNAMHGKGKIFFREYIVDDGRHLEMTTTDAPPKKKKKAGSK